MANGAGCVLGHGVLDDCPLSGRVLDHQHAGFPLETHEARGCQHRVDPFVVIFGGQRSDELFVVDDGHAQWTFGIVTRNPCEESIEETPALAESASGAIDGECRNEHRRTVHHRFDMHGVTCRFTQPEWARLENCRLRPWHPPQFDTLHARQEHRGTGVSQRREEIGRIWFAGHCAIAGDHTGFD